MSSKILVVLCVLSGRKVKKQIYRRKIILCANFINEFEKKISNCSICNVDFRNNFKFAIFDETFENQSNKCSMQIN